MSSSAEGNFDSVKSYWLLILFLVFVVIEIALDLVKKALDRRTKRNRGLRHVVHRLQEEFVGLGFVSFLLVVFQDLVVKICIEDAAAQNDVETGSKRRLLSGAVGNACGAGKQSLWPVATLHQVHILVFLIGATHVLYACVSMAVCLYKVRTWRAFEKQREQGLKPIHRRFTKSQRGCTLWTRAFFLQFVNTVNAPVYLALRRLFVERMEIEDDFDFHAFLVQSVEEDFTKVVGMEWLMWLIAGLWIVLPAAVHVAVWLSFACCAVMLAVGAKLGMIIIKLAHRAYKQYAHQLTPAQRSKSAATLHGGSHAARPMLSRISGNILQRLARPSPSVRATTTQPPSAIAVWPSQQQPPAAAAAADRKSLVSKKDTASTAGKEVGDQTQSLATDSVLLDVHTEVHGTERTAKGGNQTGSMGVGDAAATHDKLAMHRRGIKRFFSHRFSQGYRVTDAAQLFWFQRPLLMLRLYQYSYFVNSLLISFLIFEAWQNVHVAALPTSHNMTWFRWTAVPLAVLLMLHSALYVLPVYALTTAAGSHCPDSVLAYAEKQGMFKPVTVQQLRLQRESMNAALPPTTAAATSDVHHDQVQGETAAQHTLHSLHDGTNTSMSVLARAVLKSQLARLSVPSTSAHTGPPSLSTRSMPAFTAATLKQQLQQQLAAEHDLDGPASMPSVKHQQPHASLAHVHSLFHAAEQQPPPSAASNVTASASRPMHHTAAPSSKDVQRRLKPNLSTIQSVDMTQSVAVSGRLSSVGMAADSPHVGSECMRQQKGFVSTVDRTLSTLLESGVTHSAATAAFPTQPQHAPVTTQLQHVLASAQSQHVIGTSAVAAMKPEGLSSNNNATLGRGSGGSGMDTPFDD